MDTNPHVVIVGGGFGGLNTVRGLARAPVRVTLVDKRNDHLFRPLLYQVATGLLSADEISAPLRSIFSRQPNRLKIISSLLAEGHSAIPCLPFRAIEIPSARLVDSNQRPPERHESHQHCELDDGEPGADARQVARGEIAVRITDDQHAGLIGE